MKRILAIIFIIVLVPLFFAAVTDTNYVILGWNDLGMHCANKAFAKMAILPPYNNLMVQVIKKGDAGNMPEIVTGNYKVTYEVPGNTYSVGKTDFWTYVNQLLGVNPAPNTGLTGAGLSGNMDTLDNHFQVKGVPITPYPDNDLVNEHPYQMALMKVYDAGNNLLAETQNVIPVSNEISCVSAGCHSSEQNVLNEHEDMPGFLPNGPNLCATCHADNALGMPGTPGVKSLSYVIHYRHRNMTTNCYKCHPGANTQCYRDVMFTQGITCQDCHGTMANIASTINAGRQPWLQEPSCASTSCHDNNHAPEPNKLFKDSKGHGGLYCSACHGSPHAVVPTNQPGDNYQNNTLQGFDGKLMDCTVCHGVNPTSPGPHGAMAVGIQQLPSAGKDANGITSIFPNPVTDGKTTIAFSLEKETKVRILILDMNGREVAILAHRSFNKGSYSMELNTSSFAKGTYIAQISGSGIKGSKRFIVL